MTYKLKQQGFTIVELLIVIVVIGILAALVITTFTGIQQKARDTERTTDIKALHGQIEAYYAQNGYYPQLSDVTTTNLRGLDAGALVDPKGGSIQATSDATHYGYTPTQSDGTTACTTAAKDCAKYKLIATLEGGGTFEKDSLN
jgi:prepilin-type N-terminal cleavage/methylation domain-containing protein